jgi:hypothetical protein
MTRSLLRPALFSLAILSALAFASHAQDDPAPDAGKGQPKDVGKDEPDDTAKSDDAPKADAAAPAPRDFSGKYLADGVSNGGRGYKAMVEILREGEVYQVVWALGPNEGYMGIGMVEGEALCVGWSIGQVPGVVVYKPDTKEGSKKLVGRWTAPGSRGKTYTETLTPLP